MENKNELVLSSLGHTWILDLDATIVKHNGYKDGGTDVSLDGALDFLKPSLKKILSYSLRHAPKR